MEVTVLVGNGFNWFILEYLKSRKNLTRQEIRNNLSNYKRKNDISDQQLDKQILAMRDTMNEYCKLLDFLKLQDDSNGEDTLNKGENALKEISRILEKLDTVEKEDEVNKITQLIETLVADKIINIFSKDSINKSNANKFKYVNATIKTIFKVDRSFSIRFNESMHELEYQVYTTNYDYIVNSVFCEIYNTNLASQEKAKNLHGHIEDKKNSIVCCAPSRKKEKIAHTQNYIDFCSDIRDSNTIILFGLSLDADPHILDILGTKRNSNFIIITNNSESFLNSESSGFMKNNRVQFIETSKNENNMNDEFYDTPRKLVEKIDATISQLYSL